MRVRMLIWLLGLVIVTSSILPGQQNELRTVADGLAGDIAASGKKAIAVVDFTDLSGNPTELGRFLAEELSVALARTHKGFEVIDRGHLKAILTENKLAATGLIDPSTAKKVGQIAGADALVTGSMTPFRESVRVTIKVIATDTARIIAADSTDLPKTQTIAELLSSGLDSSAPRSPSPVVGRSPSYSAPNNTPSFSGLSGPAGQSTLQTSPVVIAAQFQYELLECRGRANTVECSFRITNLGPDRALTHFCGATLAGVNTTAFDNMGNQSYAEPCAIANRDDSGGFFAGVSVQAMLVSGVPVHASAIFPHLSAGATSISLITFKGSAANNATGSSANLSVSFRNIPIVR